MRFKIVSVGWKCATWWEQTLQSIEAQSVDNWDVWVVYDGGDDEGAAIQRWCDQSGERWNVTITEQQRFAVRNQVHAIEMLAPEDEDIVIFLDLDGDMFAHRDVLAHLAEEYADGTLVTYGAYRPVPFVTTCSPAMPFPPEVVAAGTYRKHMLTSGCCFNHLRTMKGRVAKAIPADRFRWVSGPLKGRFYEGGTDYIFMTAALELAGGNYKCLTEVLLLYNHANPNADNLSHPAVADAATQNTLRRPPLEALDG